MVVVGSADSLPMDAFQMKGEHIRQLRDRAWRWLRDPIKPQTAIAGAHAAVRARDFARLRKPAEYALWLIAIVTLGYCTAQYSAAAIHQSRQNARLDAMRTELNGELARSAANRGSALDPISLAKDSLVPPLGRIEIPRVGVSAIVEDGESDSTLAESVGHVPGTALPGERGNSGLAAHRDTYFRDLEDIQNGDEIYFTTATAIFKYRVDKVSIVDPSDVSVLAASSDSRLTLITCYPFHYFGPAPKRFVVTARLDDSPSH
jgi:LPXTG-site transpeptidase (sortase) family protein